MRKVEKQFYHLCSTGMKIHTVSQTHFKKVTVSHQLLLVITSKERVISRLRTHPSTQDTTEVIVSQQQNQKILLSTLIFNKILLKMKDLSRLKFKPLLPPQLALLFSGTLLQIMESSTSMLSQEKLTAPTERNILDGQTHSVGLITVKETTT